MKNVNAKVSLSNPKEGYFDEVLVEDIKDRNFFSYLDNENSQCEVCIYEDGIILFRQSDDHLLELHLRTSSYAKITSPEGILKIEVKIIDFTINSDILVMRYLINDEDRIIEIRYY